MGRSIRELAYLGKDLCVEREFLDIIQPIIRKEKVQEMRKYMHHGYVDCFSHSLQVAYMAYRIGKSFSMDYKALARAGMLHDFYLYDWHVKGGHEGFHGLRHAQIALDNANRHFEMSDREMDIIKWHMWPLNIGIPKYKESWAMMLADRLSTVLEYLHIAPLQLRMYQ